MTNKKKIQKNLSLSRELIELGAKIQKATGLPFNVVVEKLCWGCHGHPEAFSDEFDTKVEIPKVERPVGI